MSEQISLKQFLASNGVEDWRLVSEGAVAHFATDSFATAARFVDALAKLPGIEQHQPAVDIRADGVTVRLITYTESYFGPGTADVDIGRKISETARTLGLRSDPSKVQSILIIPGAPSVPDVLPFWRAALGYEPRRDSPKEDLVDPNDRGPAFWFETMKEPRADGGGSIHVCVWLPREQAEARVKAALAAGGRMVRDRFAPSWWTLADAAGNEIDIATAVARD